MTKTILLRVSFIRSKGGSHSYNVVEMTYEMKASVEGMTPRSPHPPIILEVF